MNLEDARSKWQSVVAEIRAQKANFQPWSETRRSLSGAIKEQAAALIRGWTKGLIDFHAYSPSTDMVVLVPRSRVKNADFIVVYQMDDGKFDYFGVRKDPEAGPVETTRSQVKLGFVEAVA